MAETNPDVEAALEAARVELMENRRVTITPFEDEIRVESIDYEGIADNEHLTLDQLMVLIDTFKKDGPVTGDEKIYLASDPEGNGMNPLVLMPGRMVSFNVSEDDISTDGPVAQPNIVFYPGYIRRASLGADDDTLDDENLDG